MSLRDRVAAAVRDGRLDELAQLAAADPRVLRHLMRQMYDIDEALRRTAASGIALVARHHPRLRKDILKRLVWAMDNDSGTHAPNAPEVVLAIAKDDPEALMPVVSDLVRLAGDATLYDGLAAALELVIEHRPGAVGQSIGAALTRGRRAVGNGRPRRAT